MNENKSAPWFRILALCTAVGLGGGYVWWQQQKAATATVKPAEDAAALNPNSEIGESSLVTQEQADRLLMSSSKSTTLSAPGLAKEQGEKLIPSLKNGIIELKPEQSKERTLMPGSKVGIIELQPEETKERILLPSSKSIPMPIFRERRLVPANQPEPNKP